MKRLASTDILMVTKNSKKNVHCIVIKMKCYTFYNVSGYPAIMHSYVVFFSVLKKEVFFNQCKMFIQLCDGIVSYLCYLMSSLDV